MPLLPVPYGHIPFASWPPPHSFDYLEMTVHHFLFESFSGKISPVYYVEREGEALTVLQ